MKPKDNDTGRKHYLLVDTQESKHNQEEDYLMITLA